MVPNVGKKVQAHPAASPWIVAGRIPKEDKVSYYMWKKELKFDQMGNSFC